MIFCLRIVDWDELSIKSAAPNVCKVSVLQFPFIFSSWGRFTSDRHSSSLYRVYTEYKFPLREVPMGVAQERNEKYQTCKNVQLHEHNARYEVPAYNAIYIPDLNLSLVRMELRLLQI